MREDDFSYYRHRAIQEQLAAQKASCEPARRRHDELATLYRFRAAMLSRPPEQWTDVFEKEPEKELA